MVNLGQIDFQMGLPLNINVKHGPNKLKVHMSKNMAKMATLWPKIGQDATYAPSLNWNNIFHPILTSDTTIFQVLGFDTFLLRGLTWAVLRAWTQNHPLLPAAR